MRLVKMCFFVGGFSAVQLATVVEAKPLETIENLSKAYVVEADAFNKYGLFAAQADKDGYPMVARLFRAAALSEIIHSRNHSAAIDSLGGKLMNLELKQVKVYNEDGSDPDGGTTQLEYLVKNRVQRLLISRGFSSSTARAVYARLLRENPLKLGE